MLTQRLRPTEIHLTLGLLQTGFQSLMERYRHSIHISSYFFWVWLL
jgi:hypothetical protein